MDIKSVNISLHNNITFTESTSYPHFVAQRCNFACVAYVRPDPFSHHDSWSADPWILENTMKQLQTNLVTNPYTQWRWQVWKSTLVLIGSNTTTLKLILQFPLSYVAFPPKECHPSKSKNMQPLRNERTSSCCHIHTHSYIHLYIYIS